MTKEKNYNPSPKSLFCAHETTILFAVACPTSSVLLHSHSTSLFYYFLLHFYTLSSYPFVFLPPSQHFSSATHLFGIKPSTRNPPSSPHLTTMLRRTLSMLNWRDQGISYVKYLNVCTESLHMAVKEKSRGKYVKFSSPNYTAIKGDGAGGIEEVKKVPIYTKDY